MSQRSTKKNVAAGTAPDAGSVPARGLGGPAAAAAARSERSQASAPSDVAIHRIEGSILAFRRGAVERSLSGFFGPPERRSSAPGAYTATADFEGLAAVDYFDDPAKAPDRLRDSIYVQIEAEAFDELTGHQTARLLMVLRGCEFACSRLDLVFDDRIPRVHIPRLVGWAEMDDVEGLDRFDVTFGRELADGVSGSRGQPAYDRRQITFSSTGWSEGGAERLHVFDAALMLGESNPCVRWKAEFHGDRADNAFGRLCDVAIYDEPGLARVIGHLVTGTISFTHRRDQDHPGDRPRMYDFWRAIRADIAGPIQIHRPDGRPSREEYRQRLALSATLLATVRELAEDRHRTNPESISWPELVEEIADRGLARLGPRDCELLDAAAPKWRERREHPEQPSDPVSGGGSDGDRWSA